MAAAPDPCGCRLPDEMSSAISISGHDAALRRRYPDRSMTGADTFAQVWAEHRKGGRLSVVAGFLPAISAVFSLVLNVLMRRRRHPADASFAAPRETDPRGWPSIDVIIPVHNEAAVIADKIRNTAALVYPSS